MKKVNLVAVFIRCIAAGMCFISTLGGALYTNDWYGFITIWIIGSVGAIVIDKCIANSFK